MGKEEFKALAADMKNVIVDAEEILEKCNVAGSAWMTLGSDGFVNFQIQGEDWELTRYTGSGDFVMESKYKEVV